MRRSFRTVAAGQWVARALRRDFASLNITASVSCERVPGTTFDRLRVVAPMFAKMGHGERQAWIWRVASTAVKRDVLFKVLAIATLTPDEAS